MITTHTPGPWHIMDHDKEMIYITSADGGICKIPSIRHFEQQKANAKLISAAPELLEACKEALRMYEKLQPAGGWQYVHDSLRSAIQKATE